MIRRTIQALLRRRLKSSPAAALVGPRQCGKTTLAKALGGNYFDLEQEADRLKLDLEWDRLVEGKALVVLDEAQSWPDVFLRLRGAIDRDRKRMGRFLMLGSIAPSLMIHVSQSLAGRLSIVELTPFLWGELPRKTANDRLWLCGGFPDGGVLSKKQFPHWEHDYVALLTQRDLPNWGLPAKPQVTNRLLRMLGALNGQVWNASQVGQGLGLTYKTVNSYLDFLVGAYLIRRLQPYQSNIRKRLVKSPKIFWRDTGLLHAVMNVADAEALLSQPWVGASWEGFCIEQALGALSLAGHTCEPYYFRTSDHHEIDLVLDFGSERWAIEFKLTTSPRPADMDSLNTTADLIRATRRFLVSKTAVNAGSGDHISCDLPTLIDHLRARTRPKK